MGDAKRRRALGEVREQIAALPEDAVVEAPRDAPVRFISGIYRPGTLKPVYVQQKVTHAELAAMDKESKLNTQWAEGLAEVRHKRFLASLARHGKVPA